MSKTSKLKELEYGDVKIADDVVATIANISTAKIEGVVQLKGGIASDIADFLGMKNNIKGVKVNGEDGTIDLNLSVVVAYGTKIPDMAKRIQLHVKEAIESMTELAVSSINVHVVGVKIATDSAVEKVDD